MPTVRNSGAVGKISGRSVRIGKSEERFDLPTKPTAQSGSLSAFSFLIHGEKKIGKTRLALEPDPKETLILQFDPPQISYKRMEVICESWSVFRKALKELERLAKEDKFPYKRVVIDRCDLWFYHAERQTMLDNAITDMSEMPYGGAYKYLEQLFTDAVDRVLRLPCGKWFLCHSTWKEVETRSGEKTVKLLPNLNNRADTILNGKCDAWFAYAYKGPHRVLVIQGDERTGAGHRIEGHFEVKKVVKSTKPGRADKIEYVPVQEIPMGTSPQEAYANLESAFNNELEETSPYEDEDFEPQERVKKKFKIKDKKGR